MDPTRLRQLLDMLKVVYMAGMAFFMETFMVAALDFTSNRAPQVPYHTSILTGYGWVLELLLGHPERIHTELGMYRETFDALVEELHAGGQFNPGDLVTLEEQLAIFLYTCVTGLTSPHVGERFQHSTDTINKYVSILN